MQTIRIDPVGQRLTSRSNGSLLDASVHETEVEVSITGDSVLSVIREQKCCGSRRHQFYYVYT